MGSGCFPLRVFAHPSDRVSCDDTIEPHSIEAEAEWFRLLVGLPAVQDLLLGAKDLLGEASSRWLGSSLQR